MVKVKEDLTGQVFGRLTVLGQAEDYISPNGNREARWLCECNCEKHGRTIASKRHLKNGEVTSCGCARIERAIQQGHDNKKYNEFKLNLNDEHGYYGIGLTSNTNKEFYFDMEDYDLIKDFCWREHVRKDATYSMLESTMGKSKKIIKMHQLIGFAHHDHIDRNPLNNRKYNLRPATQQENCMNRSIRSDNTSGITGVAWDKKSCKWRAYISQNGKLLHLGLYDKKEDAIKARLDAVNKNYGEFSAQKKLYQQYDIQTTIQ